MLALAGAGVLTARTYHARVQRRPLELWGSGAALLLLNARSVEVLALARGGPDEAVEAERLIVDGRLWFVTGRKDVSSAPGLSHVRQSLLNDRSYNWQAVQPHEPPAWDCALVFAEAAQQVTLLLDFDGGRARLLPGGAEASLAPAMPAIARYLGEHVRDVASSRSSALPPSASQTIARPPSGAAPRDGSP